MISFYEYTNLNLFYICTYNHFTEVLPYTAFPTQYSLRINCILQANSKRLRQEITMQKLHVHTGCFSCYWVWVSVSAAAAAATACNKSRNHNRDLWMLFLLLLLLLGWCRRCFKHFYDVSAAFMSAMRRLKGVERDEACVGWGRNSHRYYAPGIKSE